MSVDAPQSPFHNNQFGGSLGGPLWKDKTFFFSAYEGQRESGAQPEQITVPSQAEITAEPWKTSQKLADRGRTYQCRRQIVNLAWYTSTRPGLAWVAVT